MIEAKDIVQLKMMLNHFMKVFSAFLPPSAKSAAKPLASLASSNPLRGGFQLRVIGIQVAAKVG